LIALLAIVTTAFFGFIYNFWHVKDGDMAIVLPRYSTFVSADDSRMTENVKISLRTENLEMDGPTCFSLPWTGNASEDTICKTFSISTRHRNTFIY
jgi:hypothetical protein